MKYSKYFGAMFKEIGWPTDPGVLSKILNIAVLEGKLEGINVYRLGERGVVQNNKYDMDYYRVSKTLTELTGNIAPDKLLKSWVGSYTS